MPRTRPAYPDEFRQEAVAMVRGGRSVRDVAESLGVSQQSLRKWVKQIELDGRERDDGLRSEEREELRRLRRENARLSKSEICSSEPRPSSRRRPRPGDRLSDHLGAEGPHPGLRRLRAARRLPLGLL